MKRVLCIAICLALIAGAAYAFTSSTGSGRIASSKVVVGSPVFLVNILIFDDGSNALTVTAYDSAQVTTDVTKEIGTYRIPAGDSSHTGMLWSIPRRCKEGIYISISGGAGYAIVDYTFD